jgi:hypothetical protein
MHKKGAAKGQENQRSNASLAITAPPIHRKSTMLSTPANLYARGKRRGDALSRKRHLFHAMVMTGPWRGLQGLKVE